MLDLIGSNEFGDWLITELSEASRLSKSADADLSHAARRRLDTLEVAKDTLFEFLILQQKMMDAASKARATGTFQMPRRQGPATHWPPINA